MEAKGEKRTCCSAFLADTMPVTWTSSFKNRWTMERFVTVVPCVYWSKMCCLLSCVVSIFSHYLFSSHKIKSICFFIPSIKSCGLKIISWHFWKNKETKLQGLCAHVCAHVLKCLWWLHCNQSFWAQVSNVFLIIPRKASNKPAN